MYTVAQYHQYYSNKLFINCISFKIHWKIISILISITAIDLWTNGNFWVFIIYYWYLCDCPIILLQFSQNFNLDQLRSPPVCQGHHQLYITIITQINQLSIVDPPRHLEKITSPFLMISTADPGKNQMLLNDHHQGCLENSKCHHFTADHWKIRCKSGLTDRFHLELELKLSYHDLNICNSLFHLKLI